MLVREKMLDRYPSGFYIELGQFITTDGLLPDVISSPLDLLLFLVRLVLIELASVFSLACSFTLVIPCPAWMWAYALVREGVLDTFVLPDALGGLTR
jgi:hypothetical protein